MNKENWWLNGIAIVLIIIIGLLAWSNPARAEHVESGGYPDMVTMVYKCNIYGGVSVAIWKDLQKGGDIAARWIISDVFTPRMRAIFVPLIAELQKNYKTISETEAHELGRIACMKYFADWAVPQNIK